MRRKGSRFTLEVWGLRVCSLDVAFTSATVRDRSHCPQPFATVRVRSLWLCLGWVFATVVTFGGFRRRVASFRVAGVALCDIPTCFHNVSKVALRGRRNTFASLSEDELQFSRQPQHFGNLHRHFAWQAQHFRRVASRVFYELHSHGCVKWGHGAKCVAGVAFCEMCWKLTEASHKTSILRLQIFRF